MAIAISEINTRLNPSQRKNLALSGLVRIGCGAAMATTSAALGYTFTTLFAELRVLGMLGMSTHNFEVKYQIMNAAVFGIPAVVSAGLGLNMAKNGLKDLLRVSEDNKLPPSA